MSIYSGFATRAQEEAYDQCIDSLLFILQRRIVKFYKNEEADEEKFIGLVMKIHQQLKSMENNKYLEPKTSLSISQLIKYMQIHQKNITGDKNKTSQFDLNRPATHEPLPIVEHKLSNDENHQKKKQSLWVERKPKAVDQQIQTMGTIYEKKDGNTPKQSNVSKKNNQRHVVSALKTKYGQKFEIGRHQRGQELPPPTFGHSFKNRSQSHHLANNEAISYQSEVKNHLKQIEIGHKRRRKSKLNQRLGLKDLNTQQEASEYEVGDIIKEYVSRIKRKYQSSDVQKIPYTFNNKTNDF